MAIAQQKFREIVFQLLYSLDFFQASHEEIVELAMPLFAVTKKVIYEAIGRVELVIAVKEGIDRRIAEASIAYDFERISSVELNILRLGVFELLHDAEAIPGKVAIAEAIRMTRKFSTVEGAKYVNAVLDKIFQSEQLSVACQK